MKDKNSPPIDAVFSWVDGDDPNHQAKIARCLTIAQKKGGEAEPTRFRSVNEILYSVSSILRFASFVRKVFIVTDQQTPPILENIRAYFPDQCDKIEIVDHNAIFRGYEHLLPTFNSTAIETMLFRIPGLSENFIYLNDDFFLVAPTTPQVFFREDLPVLRGYWRRKPSAELFFRNWNYQVQRAIYGENAKPPRPSYKVGQWRAAELIGYKNRYLWTDHVPHPGRKSILEDFFAQHPDLLERNASFKFRDIRQFNTQALAYHLEISQGNTVTDEPRLIYMKSVNRSQYYVEKKLAGAEKSKPVFACFQSLDLASKSDLEQITEWLDDRIIRSPNA